MSDERQIPLDFEHQQPEAMTMQSRYLRRDLSRRRSVRDFATDAIPGEVVANAVAAAASAPSGANLQPWHFAVITDPEMKRKIRTSAEETEERFYAERITEEWRDALEPLDVDTSKPFLTQAPTLIAVFRRNHVEGADGVLRKTYYPMESTGIATGILISTLHMSGLATLPYTPSPMGFLGKLLDRPETDVPFLLLAVGYPAQDATVPALEREPLERVASFI